MIVEDNVALVEPPGNAEGVSFAAYFPGVDYSGLGQRSEGDRDRYPADGIVHHLVMVEDLDRIGP